MAIEKDAEKILEEFSKTLDKVPELEGTYYITDNLNLNREDESEQNDSTKIVRNARTDKDGNVVVKKAEWTG
ncbi:MAG: Asp-tRNA(Asn) amidotransferase subunit GatC [Methanobrevibacter ruminantium]|jgi:aspartyl-tRNA(Asn)/glutamyl-tRNA(Gln) amidotransferase subunit C|uniref:Asp-tRNA(Asn) amidotransferase subunit GatC n=1 Tax=Methanobrevibacter TaxID=2172 RepID=UPI00262733F9|nr:Asp-tRNA(Asn) amidotransferase subunit GatC [Methanobrevibacter ruminantium]MCI5736429.1 Asp-tRNA(Asn) amidotransferase subunit GatC [Methanobrevibacter ruminantium]MDD6049143.1 Asp-tRNA(Asn) amidotransferase subunit GatC [Methanobrevibacter ruminantium]MDO5843409.1 Asp-tRNA(Asn) amidotransferase subunit GatC [Methanobrevibacter ruminantium]